MTPERIEALARLAHEESCDEALWAREARAAIAVVIRTAIRESLDAAVTTCEAQPGFTDGGYSGSALRSVTECADAIRRLRDELAPTARIP